MSTRAIRRVGIDAPAFLHTPESGIGELVGRVGRVGRTREGKLTLEETLVNVSRVSSLTH